MQRWSVWFELALNQTVTTATLNGSVARDCAQEQKVLLEKWRLAGVESRRLYLDAVVFLARLPQSIELLEEGKDVDHIILAHDGIGITDLISLL